MNKIALNDNWMLYEAPLSWQKDRLPQVLRKEGALPCSLPCDVRMPLIGSGVIEDPVEADNFRRSMWVEQRSWWFTKEFDWPGGDWDAAELTLDRLDFGADILLNGVWVGRHESVHYPFTRDVREWLLTGKNTLAVRLTCGAERVTAEDVAGIGGVAFTEEGNGVPDRGDRRRAMIRKPQYAFGWDWAPRIATCGIGEALIRAYDKIAIRRVMFSTVSIAGNSARVRVEAEVENLLPVSTLDADVSVTLLCEGRAAASASDSGALLLSGLNWFSFELDVEDAVLWWPNGYGGQPLYTLEVSATARGVTETSRSIVGIRTLALDTARLDGGNRRFAVTVNGVPVQCKGGNWIPADCLYARVTGEKYTRLLEEAREANFTMLRVWGGGLYEKEIFYDLCDRLGLLVWQDFMFACAAYPDYLESFRTEVYKELDWQTKRLGGRACLAMLCGNNENHWLVNAAHPDLGGLIIYNRMAPEAVHRNCPHVPWWPSSPYGGGNPNDNGCGDRHHWHDCMMNPEMEKRITPEEYDNVAAKFVSEYGYPGPCPISSIRQYFGGKLVDRFCEIWNLHNNTFEKRTVAAGIGKHYIDPEALTLEQYVLYASLTQALMLGYSLEAIRSTPECWGALFWMYNDCWGETGWTVIDYYQRRKPSYYAVKRAFAPLKLVLRERDGQVAVIAHNEGPEAVQLDIEYGYVSFDGSVRDTKTTPVTLPARSRGTALRFAASGQDDRAGLWFARAAGLETVMLRRRPFRELAVPAAALTVSGVRDDGKDLVFTVRAEGYAHAVHFGFGDVARLSDEYFDLLPGEEKEIRAYGEAEKEARAYSV